MSNEQESALSKFRITVEGDVKERDEALKKLTNISIEPCKAEFLENDPRTRRDIRCTIEDLAPSRSFIGQLHRQGCTYLPIVIELEKSTNPLRVNFGLIFSSPSDIGLAQLTLLRFYIPTTIEEMDVLYTWATVPEPILESYQLPEQVRIIISRFKATFDPNDNIKCFLMSISIGEILHSYNIDWSIKNEGKIVGEKEFGALVSRNPQKMIFSLNSSIYDILCSRTDKRYSMWSDNRTHLA